MSTTLLALEYGEILVGLGESRQDTVVLGYYWPAGVLKAAASTHGKTFCNTPERLLSIVRAALANVLGTIFSCFNSWEMQL